jgi:sulfoxide reductase catalytic subunit YedY
MNIHAPRPHDPIGGTETPESTFHNRRQWLWAAGFGAASIAAGAAWRRWSKGADDQVLAAGRWNADAEERLARHYPATGNPEFTYDRTETPAVEAARYTNFYEFSRFKWCWKYVGQFRPDPWTLVVDGLCRRPLSLDLDDLYRRFAPHYEQRQYRHRCVEKWAMAVPWSGIPLAAVLKAADPLAQATHVRFVSFDRPSEAPHRAGSDDFPWPYTEGLTLAEATSDLTFLALGVYGRPLLKQHGAPVRLVVPWKYGYKSAKSIVRIELVGREPATFWSTLNPLAYPFESNVDPAVPRPWDQSSERMLGSGQIVPTQKFNGYGKWVAAMYS